MKSLLLKLGAAVGVDSAIINIITARLWSLLAGPISIFLIAHRLSPQEQGFYYTYSGVLGARAFLELGLVYVVLQFASHEMAGLQWEGNRLSGDSANYVRLADLLRKSVRWYSVVSALVLALVLPAGLWFLDRNQADAAAANWKGPWILLTIAAAGSMGISPVTAIIEGCGRVAEVTRVRVWEGMAMGVTLWIGLLSGCRLYSSALAWLACFLVTLTWMLTTKRQLLGDLLFRAGPSTLSWWKEIAPMQWRTAVSQISIYVAYQFFTPAAFATYGSELAGRLGMTLSLITVVAMVSLQWMQTKAAPFGQMVAQGARAQLDILYRRTLWQVMFFYALGCTALAAVIKLIFWWRLPLANRLLDLPTTLVFMTAFGVNQVVACRSVYTRAHKSEPFYGLQLANGVMVGIILIFLMPRMDLVNIGFTYLLCTCLPMLLISGLILGHFRTEKRSARSALR